MHSWGAAAPGPFRVREAALGPVLMYDAGVKVLLIGLRGCGKTTLGRLLSGRWSVPFVDLDDRTAALLGASSAGEGLRLKGESAFREAEAAALHAALAEPGEQILALGGGTPTAPGAAKMIRDWCGGRRWPVVYLALRPESLVERLERLNPLERPPLTGLVLAEEVRLLHKRRDDLYRELASHVIDAEGKSPAEIADLVGRACDSMDWG
ncbi:MAG: shikimate kinase [Leptolyngbya sp. PLA1]|nr:shikimate kinase [Leptolyngbya sp. PLA1]